jgi:hypothetical protein
MFEVRISVPEAPSAVLMIRVILALGEMVRTQGHKRRTVPNFLEGPIKNIA